MSLSGRANPGIIFTHFLLFICANGGIYRAVSQHFPLPLKEHHRTIYSGNCFRNRHHVQAEPTNPQRQTEASTKPQLPFFSGTVKYLRSANLGTILSPTGAKLNRTQGEDEVKNIKQIQHVLGQKIGRFTCCPLLKRWVLFIFCSSTD